MKPVLIRVYEWLLLCHCREEREKFIKAKYVEKEFLADIPRNDKSISDVSTSYADNL